MIATTVAVFVWFVRPGLRRQRKGIREMANSFRVLRGGSWYFGPRMLWAAYRFRYYPEDRFIICGFRAVCASRTPSAKKGGKGDGN
jgi:formylglycine-generating enzyme required for sulfatase activity